MTTLSNISLGSGAGGRSAAESSRSSEGGKGGGGGGSEKSCPIFSNSAKSFSVSVESSAAISVLITDTRLSYVWLLKPADAPG